MTPEGSLNATRLTEKPGGFASVATQSLSVQTPSPIKSTIA